MFEDNTKKVNKILVTTLSGMSIVFVILTILCLVDILTFTKWLMIIFGVSFVLTIIPRILYRNGVNNEFLKYFTLIILGLIICLMGTNNKIGIYITYIVAPAASCLYFDRKLTLRIGVVSYILMCIGVFINAAGRLEIEVYEWSQGKTFFMYILGFTIEYIILMIFLYKITERAAKMMEAQNEAFLKIKSNEAKHTLLLQGSKDIIFDYNVETGRYSSNRSLFDNDSESNKPFELDNLLEYVEKFPGYVDTIKELIDAVIEKDSGLFLEKDFSVEVDGKKLELWFQIEGFCIKDINGKPITIVAKLHNITENKLLEKKMANALLNEELYKSPFASGVNAIRNEINSVQKNFTQSDFAKLQAGHQNISDLLDFMKYSENIAKSLEDILVTIGGQYDLARICIQEFNLEEGIMNTLFQWTLDPKYKVDVLINKMTKQEAMKVRAMYEARGYLEFGPSIEPILAKSGFNMDYYNSMIKPGIIGHQLWLPTITDGKYSGCVVLDRKDAIPFDIVDKFLLSELVSAITAYINRIKADNANRAKSDFLSTMSHEIRTPMNAIIGMSEVTLREEMSDEVRKNLNIIHSSSKGLLAIINDILDFSKIESGKIDIVEEEYEPYSIVTDLVNIANSRNEEKKLDLQFDIDSNIPRRCKGDSVRIKQVMLNLVNNAIKYTDEGYVKVKLHWNNGAFEFSVKDSGQGIRQEDMNKLFKSFSQVDISKNHHKEGTGLGLSICKRLMDIMGGDISAESEYGKGSTFMFTIKQEVIDSNPSGDFDVYNYGDADNTKKEEAFTAEGSNILIVDDNEINRVVAGGIFAPINANLDMAENGEEAVNKCKEKKYDLILMDYFMPVMDGAMATKIIRQDNDGLNKDTPIIAMTADAISGTQDKLIEAGMNDYISKPIDISEAMSKTKMYLGKKGM